MTKKQSWVNTGWLPSRRTRGNEYKMIGGQCVTVFTKLVEGQKIYRAAYVANYTPDSSDALTAKEKAFDLWVG